MAFLRQHALQNRGDGLSLAHCSDNGEIDLLAMLSLDRERRNFIYTTSGTAAGELYSQVHWRQTPQGAQLVSLKVLQPKSAELCYYSCALIDYHSRCRQDDL
jgi:hypothetical protein